MDLRARIEALGPEQSSNPSSAVTLADACYALEGGMSEVFDRPVPPPPERLELRQRCLELIRAWIPKLDAKTVKELGWRVEDRRMPLDLSAQKAELKRQAGTTPPDRTQQLADYATLPPLTGFQALGALVVDQRIAVGEWPSHGIVLDARPGVWLAYIEDEEALDGADTDRGQEMIAVHAELFDRLDALRGRASLEDEQLSIDGARMAVADATVASDEDFDDALSKNELDEFRGSVAVAFLGGDGSADLNVVRMDDRVVLAIITIY